MARIYNWPSKEDLIQAYYDNGCRCDRVAELFGIKHRQSVHQKLKSYGIELTSHLGNNQFEVMPCPDVDVLRNMIEVAEKSYAEASKALGVSKSVLLRWIEENNIKTKRTDHKKVAPPVEELRQHYITDQKSISEIAVIYESSYITVKNWLIEREIPLHTFNVSRKLMVPKITKAKLEKYGYHHFPDGIINESRGERELRDWLKSLGFDFKRNKSLIKFNGNGGFEVDMVNFDLKLAFEYNGDYYHSSANEKEFPSKSYEKWKQCHEHGIQLITVFESEWQTRKDQIKNFIASKLPIPKIIIHARKCRVEKLSFKPRDFLEENHIQGAIRQIICSYGLFHENELVGVAVFSKHHRDTKKVTLSRLCLKNGCIIKGGVNKLLKYAIKDLPYDEIITWSDNRWSTGKLYENVGFIFDGDIKYDYRYWDAKKNITRSKQSMKKPVGTVDRTETEIALEKRCYKVFDCGKKRWIFKK